MISLPEPILKSPAVFVGKLCQSVKLSCELNLISKGSCVPMAFSGSQPKAIMCLSASETKTFLAIVGAKFELVKLESSTALAPVPPDLSQ